MGNCVSAPDRDAQMRSQEIDKQIEEDSRKLKKECKILLLGSGESGKSTIVKQMKIIHQNGYTPEERNAYRQTIYKNLLDSAHHIILAMRKLAMDCEDPANRGRTEKILDYTINPAPPSTSPRRWPRPSSTYGKTPSSPRSWTTVATCFFTEALRIGAPNYVPTEIDVLRARATSRGITETRFSLGPLSIHMFDVGGQRSERKKWIHCFESVTSIIFCTALSEYDQVLLEDRNQKRMAESLILFESVINSRWFLRTSIILFLNKIDVFKSKLPKVPLERYFPEYTGGPDINKAAKYILWRFMQANRARLSVYPHLTQATDTSNIRLVFAAVKETILQNALKDSGIL
ncbi:G-protein alpha subunit [Daedaleopsis nitida]|nr:G-protein alpha subunit [Daedaleopsis nitida]